MESLKLYVMFFSLAKFQRLYDGSEFLQSMLSENGGNCWVINCDDPSGIVNMLIINKIKYKVK